MWRLLAIKPVTADQCQYDGAILYCLFQILLRDVLIHNRDVVGLDPIQKLVMHQRHDQFLVRIAHAFQKQWSSLIEVYFCIKSALVCRQRQTERMATAVARGHEDGCCFPPDVQLGRLIGFKA